MVRLREIPRTAAFAWSPGPELPLVVTGTRAGAVDADFSDETKLELWDLRLDNLDQGLELQPIASITTDSRFHDIAWAPASDEHPRGIIAGALENGSLDLWDAGKLIDGASDAFMSRTTKHTGAIKSLQFNPLKPQILATAGAKGELYIYDVNDISNPFRLGNPQARADDLECIAWNRKVPHILATGGTGGFVTIWDLKTKKASLSLSNHKKPVAAIAWDPNNATKLLTATPDDSTPVILLWDLRNSNAPERTLQGHEQGVLSLSWCQQDSDLLLSCGKDNRTLCWNPQTGELLGEFSEVTNWTFQTRFHPHNPSLTATASFDGKISIQTLQNTNSSISQQGIQGPSDGEDFFTRAQTQPQGSSFSLKKAPKWLERPIGASFGFGGKLVIFRVASAATGHIRSSKVQISTFAVDSDIGTATETFESSLRSGDIGAICRSHIENAKTDDEKADWKVIETLIAENPRKRVTEYLGLADENEEVNGKDEPQEAAVEDEGDVQQNGTSVKKPNRLSSFFADGAESDDFLSNVAATKGAKTNNPFELFSASDSASDRQITKALMLGQFEVAMKICLKEDRMADAFMIANCGGKELVEMAQAAYLAKRDQKPNYLRLLAAVIGKNLWDIVYNADLANWKESMAALCTYADPNEFPDLCEALGDRVLESGSRKDASFCYLVGSNLEKVVEIWISDLREREEAILQEADRGSTFSVHARSLQSFIEKVTVFREVTKYQDKDKTESSGWKLQSLYEKYVEYADIVAAHGHLNTAEKYLDLLPPQYPAAEVARNRVKLASRSSNTKASSRQPEGASIRSASRVHSINTFSAQPTFSAPQTSAISNPYAPSIPSASNPYAPSPTNTFSSTASYVPPQASSYGGPPLSTPSMAYAQPNNAFGAPPRNTPPSVPPPSQASKMSNWNDTPMVTKPAVSRRGTPGGTPAPMTAPFGTQQNVAPPSGPPFGGPRSTPTPPPPPPKGPAPPRMTSPLNSGPPSTVRQGPPTANPYAPPVQQPTQHYGQAAAPPPPTIPRGASPYNPPPPGPAPTNRYAPAPAMQQYSNPPPTHSQIPPPPGGRGPPPSNDTFSPQAPPVSQSSYAPNPPLPQGQAPPLQSQTIQGPPPAQTQSSQTAAPSAPKYPPGDRSHIPSNAQQMVSILTNEMQRVAGKAPASFAPQVENTQKRLNMLFDHLNNETLIKSDTIESLNELAQALQGKNYDLATKIQVDIQRDKTDECGNWMVGVKRLISMSRVTP